MVITFWGKTDFTNWLLCGLIRSDCHCYNKCLWIWLVSPVNESAHFVYYLVSYCYFTAMSDIFFPTIFVFQYSFESLFRSMHFALLDNSCREYLFLADFFMAQNNTAKDLFTAVFGKTLSLFLVSNPCFKFELQNYQENNFLKQSYPSLTYF